MTTWPQGNPSRAIVEVRSLESDSAAMTVPALNTVALTIKTGRIMGFIIALTPVLVHQSLKLRRVGKDVPDRLARLDEVVRQPGVAVLQAGKHLDDQQVVRLPQVGD